MLTISFLVDRVDSRMVDLTPEAFSSELVRCDIKHTWD